MRLSWPSTERVLAEVSLLVAVLALTVAFAGRGSPVPPTAPEELVDRIRVLEAEVRQLRLTQENKKSEDLVSALNELIGGLEREVKALRRELAASAPKYERPARTSGQTPPNTQVPTGPNAPGSGRWPLVARKLTVDLWLDERQVDVVDAALEGCDSAHRAALQEGEWRRRDGLSRSARRRAYEKVAAVLRTDQKKLFDKWLRDSKNSRLAVWFLRRKPCCGGGKKKTSVQTKEPAPKAEAKESPNAQHDEDIPPMVSVMMNAAENDTVRNRAVNLLRRQNYRGLTTDLLKILGNPKEKAHFRASCVEHLRQNAEKADPGQRELIVAALRAALSDQDVPVRRQSLLALVHMRDPKGAETAVKWLTGQDTEGVRDLAIRCVQLLGLKEHTPRIREHLRDENEVVRVAAIDALSRWGDEQSRIAFQEAAASDAAALQKAGKDALKRLAEADKAGTR